LLLALERLYGSACGRVHHAGLRHRGAEDLRQAPLSHGDPLRTSACGPDRLSGYDRTDRSSHYAADGQRRPQPREAVTPEGAEYRSGDSAEARAQESEGPAEPAERNAAREESGTHSAEKVRSAESAEAGPEEAGPESGTKHARSEAGAKSGPEPPTKHARPESATEYAGSESRAKYARPERAHGSTETPAEAATEPTHLPFGFACTLGLGLRGLQVEFRLIGLKGLLIGIVVRTVIRGTVRNRRSGASAASTHHHAPATPEPAKPFAASSGTESVSSPAPQKCFQLAGGFICIERVRG